MKKAVFGAVLVLVIVLAAASSGCTDSASSGSTSTEVAANETPTYIVGIDADYEPYSYIDTNGDPIGFDVDSVKWIADQEGFNVEILPVGWDGIIPALQAGKIDMVYSGMTITDERSEKVNFSIPYWKVNQSVAIYNDSGYTMDDFMSGNYVIGAQRGTTGAIWVEKNLIDTGIMPSENLKTYDTFPLAAADLNNKRIDFTIYDKPPMVKAIEGKPLSIIGEIDTNEEYGVAIRKSDNELLETMNEGLTKLMADPYWQELKEKYGMVD